MFTWVQEEQFYISCNSHSSIYLRKNIETLKTWWLFIQWQYGLVWLCWSVQWWWASYLNDFLSDHCTYVTMWRTKMENKNGEQKCLRQTNEQQMFQFKWVDWLPIALYLFPFVWHVLTPSPIKNWKTDVLFRPTNEKHKLSRWKKGSEWPQSKEWSSSSK